MLGWLLNSLKMLWEAQAKNAQSIKQIYQMQIGLLGLGQLIVWVGSM